MRPRETQEHAETSNLSILSDVLAGCNAVQPAQAESHSIFFWLDAAWLNVSVVRAVKDVAVTLDTKCQLKATAQKFKRHQPNVAASQQGGGVCSSLKTTNPKKEMKRLAAARRNGAQQETSSHGKEQSGG